MDERMYLPAGTIIELENHEVYTITGEPVGFGGGSILYPARRQILINGSYETDEISYVLKECYPASVGHSFIRNDDGAIVPGDSSRGDMGYLHRAQLMQMQESNVSQRIYRTASRILPIRSTSQSVSLMLPGRTPVTVPNTVTVMDSLAEKGRSLSAWAKDRKQFPPAETFRIIQQLLFALGEVHQSGYLHLDIQDGNVFLRGTLEDKNELVTLIDFGCAREMTDGKTAPIRDKVIFTTRGFSAPEILLHNDGSLQLGPEADIFSVGCLILYLLTGQRTNVRDLIENRTGIYLRSNQLRRIKCPKHLVDPLQHILAMSLARDPENRYHSVDAMLEDVTALAEALQPYRTDLRSVKYDGFICYKHGPVDSMAALTLQRALENYRAPKGISEKKKPFGRIFVDEGELGSCADFGQQIRDALKNSGWLIVICSPDTPLSPWVQLEIDTFLEYHDRSRILAVLTGGDPETSFPPQLKGNASGAGEVFAAHAISSTPGEAKKQLKGDARLKVAAPMLGTTYDSLKQRQKLYRLQKVAALTAGFLLAAVGFAAYALNRANVIAQQAVKIEEEFERALVNESLFLTEQARKRLDSNDPLGAIELALQALPSADQDRPVLTEAEYILGKALGIYTTPSSRENTAAPVGKIDTDCPFFFLSDDGTNLFAWDDLTSDSHGLIQCWDTRTMTQQWAYHSASHLNRQPILSAAGDLILQEYNRVVSLDTRSGQKNWDVSMEDLISVSLSPDGSKVIVISGERGNYFSWEGDTNTFHELTAVTLAADTAKPLQQVTFRIDGTQYIDSDIRISPNLRFAVIPTIDEGHDGTLFELYHSLYLVDLDTGACELLLDSQTAVNDILFLGDRLAVMRSRGYTLSTERNITYTYNYQQTYLLELYSLRDSRLLWQQQLTDYFDPNGIQEIHAARYNGPDAVRPGLLYTFADQCILLDQESGQIIIHYSLPAAASMILMTDTGFRTVNADGSCTVASFHTEPTLTIRLFGMDVSSVCKNDLTYYIQSTPEMGADHTIYKFQQNWSDDAYQAHVAADSNTWHIYDDHVLQAPNKVLLTDQNRVCLADIATGALLSHTIAEQYGFSEYQIVGMSDDGYRLYWADNSIWGDPERWIQNNMYYMLDFRTGNIQPLPLPSRPSDGNLYIEDTVFASEKLWISITLSESGRDYRCMYLWDMANGTWTERYRWERPMGSGDTHTASGYYSEYLLSESLTYDPELHRLSFALFETSFDTLTGLICIDTETDTITEIPLQLPSGVTANVYMSWQHNSYHWNESGTQAIFAWNDSTVIADPDGIRVCSAPAEEAAVSLQYLPDERHILAVTESGMLVRYSVEDGVCCGFVNLTEYCSNLNLHYADNCSWKFPDERTALFVCNDRGVLIDISGEDVAVIAEIDQCIGYDPANDRFISAETDNYSGKAVTIGSFPRYTVQALIQKGNAVLGR